MPKKIAFFSILPVALMAVVVLGAKDNWWRQLVGRHRGVGTVAIRNETRSPTYDTWEDAIASAHIPAFEEPSIFDTSDWKTYRSASMRLEFRYPKEMSWYVPQVGFEGDMAIPSEFPEFSGEPKDLNGHFSFGFIVRPECETDDATILKIGSQTYQHAWSPSSFTEDENGKLKSSSMHWSETFTLVDKTPCRRAIFEAGFSNVKERALMFEILKTVRRF